ncbi:hypothetical protein EDC18_101200 [Natranaerovirga pectinivora]|uniref:Type 4 fimbrial biogenesis protein PilX N-terminal domain-containing protein n=2 Tax=Natranaerovirga pectinivora TaxID=682400 RepID=A0A4R3MQ39_9FIRM|nr:hypothetical protein EDC18_101200 [Natranaerovirga pectinivora]
MIWSKFKTLLEDHRGSALIVVLLVLVVVSVLGIPLMSLSFTNNTLTKMDRDLQAAYYISEAGIVEHIEMIKSEVLSIYNSSEGDQEERFFTEIYEQLGESMITFEDSFGNTTFSEVVFTDPIPNSGNPRVYQIASIGSVNGRERRLLSSVTIEWIPKSTQSIFTDMVIFSNSSIAVPNGTITGPIGTNSSQAGSITISGGGTVNGEIFVGPSGGADVVNGVNHATPQPLSEVRELLMPPTPGYPDNLPLYPNKKINIPWNEHDLVKDGNLNITSHLLQPQHGLNTLVLDGNYQFNRITATSNYTLNIDLGGGHRTIVVNELNMNNGHINIMGAGKLTIHVLDKISFGSSSSMNNPSPGGSITQSKIDQLEIVYRGNNPFSLAGGQKIYGSIFVESANISFGAGSGVFGTIISGGNNVVLDGGTNAIVRTIYAPNANIKIEGGATVKGSVIGNSIQLDGGAYLNHDLMEGVDIPFFPPNTDDVEVDNLIIGKTPIRER